MLIRKLFLLLITFLILNISLSAQVSGILKGKIKDAITKEYIPGASIHLINSLKKGTASDIDGNYIMEVDTGYHQFLCMYMGYVNDTFALHIQANTITERDIDLHSTETFLETIVVSSGKFDQKLEEMTVSMEVLKPNLINNKNTTSIETALEQVPGLTIIDNDPQIRGGSGFTFGVGSRVAIIVDGIPLLSGDAGRPEWSYIPVENIEQIEIIKGASSVLYGSSALNGIINVRSAYPRSTPKTMINYSIGNYSLPPQPALNWYDKSFPVFTNLNFLHSRIIKKNLDFVIGGNFNLDQGYIGPPPPQAPVPDYAQSVIGEIPTFSNKDMQEIRGRLNFSLRYRSSKIAGLNYGINGNGMLNKTNMVLAWDNDSLGLYQGYPGAVFLENQKIFNLDPFIKYNNGNGISHSLVTRIFHTDNTITNNQSNTGTLYYGEYQLQRIFKKLDFTFTGGVVGSISNSHAQLYASSGSSDNKITNGSGYMQIDKKMWSILNISAGFRYEYFQMNNFQSVLAPIYRAGASLQVLRATYVRTSYGEGFRYPTITERYISTKAGLFGVFPNPDLKPEESNNFELGLKQGFKLGNIKGYFDVAGFYQKYKNTIEYLFGQWEPSIALLGFKFVNTGDSRVRGTDISIVLSTDENNRKFGFTALLGYTYVEPIALNPDYVYATDSAFGGAGKQLAYKNSSMDTTGNVLKYRFKNLIKADVEFKCYKFNVGLSYRYYSKMQNIDKAFEELEELTAALTFVEDLKAINYWKTHTGYNIFDARISYQINTKHKLSVICNNIFNVDYSLRPMKIESPRTTAVQYILTF